MVGMIRTVIFPRFAELRCSVWSETRTQQVPQEGGRKEYCLHSLGHSYKSPPTGNLGDVEMAAGTADSEERIEHVNFSGSFLQTHAEHQWCARYFPGHLLWTEI